MLHLTIIVSHTGAISLYITEHSRYLFRVEYLLVFSSRVPWNHFFLTGYSVGFCFCFYGGL